MTAENERAVGSVPRWASSARNTANARVASIASFHHDALGAPKLTNCRPVKGAEQKTYRFMLGPGTAAVEDVSQGEFRSTAADRGHE